MSGKSKTFALAEAGAFAERNILGIFDELQNYTFV
jgi:hypothetical protein